MVRLRLRLATNKSEVTLLLTTKLLRVRLMMTKGGDDEQRVKRVMRNEMSSSVMSRGDGDDDGEQILGRESVLSEGVNVKERQSSGTNDVMAGRKSGGDV